MSVDDPFGQHSPTPSTVPSFAPVSDPADLDDDDPGDDGLDADANEQQQRTAGDPEAPDLEPAEGNRVGGARAAAVIEYVAIAFADNPDAIEIETRQRGSGSDVSLYIHADRGDVGRLIGRRGRVINALRQAARAAGAIDGERVQLDIAE